MPTVLQSYIQQWCHEHGWTDLFVEQRQFWAFPPGAVLPMPVPVHALEGYYSSREASGAVKLVSLFAIGVALGAILLTMVTFSPIPLILAFCFCAISVAVLEEISL